MDSSSSSPPPTSASAVNPLNQTFYLQGPHNEKIPVWLPMVDETLYQAFGVAINYSSQIGACFVMLLVVLTMTAKTRFYRASTLINLAGLVVGTIRCTLLALYFTSSYLEFYMFFSGDHSHIRNNDTRISAVATFFSLPQLILIEAALFLQAYSMIRLWPSGWKAVTMALSVLVVLFAVGFKCASVAIRMHTTLAYLYIAHKYVWVLEADLAFSTATICWFCFVFIIRLVIHMWEYRSILPPLGGLSAMDVLVVTNGILMLVPVVFAALEFPTHIAFESASLCLTSVVVILPLGTLIAQRMTTSTTYASYSGRSGGRGIGSGGAAGGGGGGRGGSGGSGGSGSDHAGAYSRATSDTATSKKHLFGSWSHASDTTASVVSGGLATQVKIQAGNNHAYNGRSSTADSSLNKSKFVADPVDRELQQIDATPIMTPTMDTFGERRVRVDHEVEVVRQNLI
ncbi:mating-type alpha-pheromone receptor [Niveomyces insectorum RCEF 264]|uniref:Mating-type alpha-pheromone receptor n=1 Tax=Niveomyces insectorum RCEF 264 TaxID=1081102 RepID=A0A162MTF1_9HYPO|nr:mating-type alpha-pheromone receptor [Niveomyces insectorum RCEF 264]